jgi:predicted nuclease of predicted toxin-antitoxin system
LRFLLDERISPLVASLLRDRGHDAVAVTERHGLRGMPDRALLQVALEEDRALVTFDVGDVGRLAGRMARTAEAYPGIVLVAASAYPPALDGVGRLAGALDALAAANPGGLPSRVAWLMPLD